MNKFMLSLVLLAIAFWGIFISRLIARIPENSPQTMASLANLPTLDDLHRWMQPQPLPAKDLRDPFRPAHAQVQVSRSTTRQATQPTLPLPAPVAAPPIGIDAILPGENPVAILRHRDETAIVRVGQTAWNATVESVGANSVTVIVDGTSFVLQKK